MCVRVNIAVHLSSHNCLMERSDELLISGYTKASLARVEIFVKGISPICEGKILTEFGNKADGPCWRVRRLSIRFLSFLVMKCLHAPVPAFMLCLVAFTLLIIGATVCTLRFGHIM